MNAWSRHQRILDLFTASTILASFVLLSACVGIKTLFGDEGDQTPPIVLSVDQPGNVDYEFDWQSTSIGGVSVSKFMPSHEYWRLNVFSI